MGTINYGTSNYITIGIKPYDASDLEEDINFMEELQNEVNEYGGTIEEAMSTFIQDCYEADHSNIEYLLNNKYDFYYFHVVIKWGYYEGFYIDIENNYPVCYNSWNDKQAALKEATQIKRFLLECIDLGLCEVWPGWCTSYKSRDESIKGVKQAIRDMKEEIRGIPTWEHCRKLGIEV